MTTNTASKPAESPRRYPIRYGVKQYTFPSGDTLEEVRFDDTYIHLHLVDGRIISIPLAWIPPLRDASPEERQKFYITDDRSAVVWDPDESEVNEILRLSDYLSSR
jgi:hypothetical protein